MPEIHTNKQMANLLRSLGKAKVVTAFEKATAMPWKEANINNFSLQNYGDLSVLYYDNNSMVPWGVKVLEF